MAEAFLLSEKELYVVTDLGAGLSFITAADFLAEPADCFGAVFTAVLSLFVAADLLAELLFLTVSGFTAALVTVVFVLPDVLTLVPADLLF